MKNLLRSARTTLNNFVHRYRKYHLLDIRKTPGNLVIAYMTKDNTGTGLADRFKGIISSYILAIENGRDFRIWHTSGFVLEDYLIPNEYDWRIKPEEIANGLNKVRVLQDILPPLPKLKKSIDQYHVHSVFDVVKDSDNSTLWTSLFTTLFKPSALLIKLIHHAKLQIFGTQIPPAYIAIHTRFINSLDFFEPSSWSHTLPSHERETLIDNVINKIQHLCRLHNDKAVLIFSDSPSFLKQEFPSNCYPISGEICHMAHASSAKQIERTFVDMFLMSDAQHVYNIIGEHMYPSGFSQYAAKISGSEFSRISYTSKDPANE